MGELQTCQVEGIQKPHAVRPRNDVS